MRRFLVGALCTLASMPSLASDWIISSMNADFVYYVDTSSKVRNGDTVEMWTLAVPKAPPKGIDFLLLWAEFDCKKKRARPQEMLIFNSSGKQVAKESSNEWSHPVPGSSAASQLDQACKKTDVPALFKDISPGSLAKLTREALIENGTWK